MINNRIKILLIPVFFAGCTAPPTTRVSVVEATIPISSQANVRSPEVIKAYPVNRYIDPSNPRLMHERSVVYAVERDARWRLGSNSSQQVLVGNTVTRSPMDANATARRADAASAIALMHRTDREQRRLQTAVQALSQQLADMESTQGRQREMGAGSAHASQEIAAVKNELKLLLGKQELLEYEMKQLKSAAHPGAQQLPNTQMPKVDGLTDGERGQVDQFLLNSR